MGYTNDTIDANNTNDKHTTCDINDTNDIDDTNNTNDTNNTTDMNRIWHNIFTYSRSILSSGDFPLAKIGFYDITVLALLHHSDNLQVKDVCKELGVAKSTMTSILKRLESSGYLIRRKVEHDGRGFYLGITKEGTELLKKHEEFENIIYMHILSGLNEEESSTLIKLLLKGCGMGR